jgi:hypothetical protein
MSTLVLPVRRPFASRLRNQKFNPHIEQQITRGRKSISRLATREEIPNELDR